jgi:hypothetical protein
MCIELNWEFIATIWNYAYGVGVFWIWVYAFLLSAFLTFRLVEFV